MEKISKARPQFVWHDTEFSGFGITPVQHLQYHRKQSSAACVILCNPAIKAILCDCQLPLLNPAASVRAQERSQSLNFGAAPRGPNFAFLAATYLEMESM